MDVFAIRDQLIAAYRSYVSSFINIRDARIRQTVEESLDSGALWPEPLIQLNPSFERGESFPDLVAAGVLHPECLNIFRFKQEAGTGAGAPGALLQLHRHQSEVVRVASAGHNYVLTTGTGSGKSLAYIVPIVDYILRQGSRRGIKAVVVYPMNALANSQVGELRKFLQWGYPDHKGPVTFARYTGQESETERNGIMANPPDILLTNYVMLELILTRPIEAPLIRAAQGVRFLVLDELHTYRGRQGADVALLVRRVRDRVNSPQMQIVGTSATLAGAGSYEEQRVEVAAIAARLFGAEVRPDHVIGETLRRATPERALQDPQFPAALTARVADLSRHPPQDYRRFLADPLSIWIEGEFGVTAEPGSGRLVRKGPQSLRGTEGAAARLSQVTGVDSARCADVLREGLLAGYQCGPDPDTGFPPFAFKLHQFISRGEAVYASLEPGAERHITVYGQQFKPGSRDHVLLPLVFCRECGQEYFCVREVQDVSSGRSTFLARDIGDLAHDEAGQPGFLYFSGDDPWPAGDEEILRRLPEDWLEQLDGDARLLKARKADLPRDVRVGSAGRTVDRDAPGLAGQFLRAPFRFCLHCGVSYDARQRNDFAKLALLSSEGRSTATTILSLATIRLLRESNLEPQARKLLSFLDNRQDASLQAGHFNDFVEIGLLRSALYHAAAQAGAEGLSHELLTQAVFDALGLPLAEYAADPEVRFQALKETQRALRDVLGYRLYRDLKRGWRITSPNLEQTGLLEMRYLSLDEVCEAEDVWANKHPLLAQANAQARSRIAKVLLDFMRRELAIKVDYLDPHYQERLQQQSSQRLSAPWALDENEMLEYARVLFPRSRRPDDSRSYVYLSARGGFGQYLRRSTTFDGRGRRLSLEETDHLICDLLEGLRVAGLVEVVEEAPGKGDVPGYQLPAAALRWVAGDGTRAFRDPIRVPNASSDGHRPNRFFVDFYRGLAGGALGALHGLESREHTAQVPYDLRVQREDAFRDGRLPILYCSPTMELGVDISQLNVVNMRNVPPTPANYAQRSGRAGRSGQPALVFTYCSTGSPHDQYFFRRPQRMVAGAVVPARLDLTNQDLIRAHVQAIWLAETGQSLGKSLRDLLDASGDPPSLALLPEVKDSIEAAAPRARATARAQRVLATLSTELQGAEWYTPDWLDQVLNQAAAQFDRTAERWRSLYRAALKQVDVQTRIIKDASRSQDDKNVAKRLRQEAESQLELLTQVENVMQSDFYSYRYFASEGFLPGYSFPRLPISAFIPARRVKQKDEFLSRPRFLAVTEFGPRSIVYHEGSRYIINKVIMPVSEDDQKAEESRLPLGEAKLCAACGYVHPVADGKGPDLCQRCGLPLDPPLRKLFRMQNVSTKRRDRINSDEEERTRQGYEIITGVRFAEQDGRALYRTAAVLAGAKTLGALCYGHTATIWRINRGWARRRNKQQVGFVLDVERGYWSRNDQIEEEDLADPMSARTERVIPYVEDRRNCLLFQPGDAQDAAVMVSLMAALKTAIQAVYQLEDSELAVETLPSDGAPRQILLYEAAEGGAGVLRRLLDDPAALAGVAREALRICHFDPTTGEDRRHAPRANEDCEAACYDCLMSYTNQGHHRLLDRQAIKGLLLALAGARVSTAPAPTARGEHLAMLMRLTGSELEREWLRALDRRGLRLPSRAQVRLEACGTRPDFLYDGEYSAAIYVDGPIHTQYEHRRARDHTQQEAMEDHGYLVIRFAHNEAWDAVFARYPYVFGKEHAP